MPTVLACLCENKHRNYHDHCTILNAAYILKKNLTAWFYPKTIWETGKDHDKFGQKAPMKLKSEARRRLNNLSFDHIDGFEFLKSF